MSLGKGYKRPCERPSCVLKPRVKYPCCAVVGWQSFDRSLASSALTRWRRTVRPGQLPTPDEAAGHPARCASLVPNLDPITAARQGPQHISVARFAEDSSTGARRAA
ncbi:hypothetical protein D3C87_1047060 [compost metagenome]